jgi:hypothetical protein
LRGIFNKENLQNEFLHELTLPTILTMTRALIFILCFLALTAFGQADKYLVFSKSDYPADKYSIKADTFNFVDFKIELTQVKLTDYKNANNTSVFCRIWLIVKKGSEIIDKLFIRDCEGVGGCSGIYASDKQPIKGYFILSKFGDYDGQIIIIDTSGKIKTYFGGQYFLSVDNKYLFSTYDSDLAGLTVYDLSQNKVLFTSDTTRTYLADFYFCDNKYFAIVSDDIKRLNETDIVTFDFKTNNLIKSTVNDNYISKAKKLKEYNVFTYGPCSCGRTKDE